MVRWGGGGVPALPTARAQPPPWAGPAVRRRPRRCCVGRRAGGAEARLRRTRQRAAAPRSAAVRAFTLQCVRLSRSAVGRDSALSALLSHARLRLAGGEVGGHKPPPRCRRGLSAGSRAEREGVHAHPVLGPTAAVSRSRCQACSAAGGKGEESSERRDGLRQRRRRSRRSPASTGTRRRATRPVWRPLPCRALCQAHN